MFDRLNPCLCNKSVHSRAVVLAHAARITHAYTDGESWLFIVYVTRVEGTNFSLTGFDTFGGTEALLRLAV